mgnify:CR=1 FL=1
MKDELTQQQVEQYRKQGYLVIDGFLDAGELEHWRVVTEEAVQLRIGDQTILSNQKDPDSYYAKVFTQCLRLVNDHHHPRT